MKPLFILLLVSLSSCTQNVRNHVPTSLSQYRPKMLPLKGGEFMMGHGYNPKTIYGPKHKVILSPFYMAETEVTWKQFTTIQKAFPKMDYDSVYFIADSNLQKPAIVNFEDAARYCNALSIQEGRNPCYSLFTLHCNFKADGYRLPTEAEWEYACRAGTNGQYFWIPDSAIDKAFYPETASLYVWYSDGAKVKKAQPVRQLRPNGFGLYDMVGNAKEWCNDLWDPWYYKHSPIKNPKGSSYLFNWDIWLHFGGRMTRGADYSFDNSSALTSYYRPSVPYDTKTAHFGFRPILNRPMSGDE